MWDKKKIPVALHCGRSAMSQSLVSVWSKLNKKEGWHQIGCLMWLFKVS